MKTTLVYLHSILALIMVINKAESLSDKCKTATMDSSSLGHFCLIQSEIDSMQVALDRMQSKLDKMIETSTLQYTVSI